MRNSVLIATLCTLCACASPSPNPEAISADSNSLQPVDSASKTQKDSIAMAEGPDSAFLGKKRAAGIDFYAVGQEPGWLLDIDKENIFSFNSYDGVAMNTPPVEGVVSADRKTTTYAAKVEMGEIRISITSETCTDIMSGEKFPYSVEVRIQRGVDKDFKIYKGCGRTL